MIVSVIKNYDYPVLARQTSDETGEWNGITFVEGYVGDADLCIVINEPTTDLIVKAKYGVWLVHQEAMCDGNVYFKKYVHYFDKVFTQFPIEGKNIVHTQTGLPWHINKTFDELLLLEPGVHKTDDISWVTSNKRSREGHNKRLDFLDFITDKINLKLYGKGFQFIEDKFDALYPTKYTLAIENSSVEHYWSEKIADAYLSWCMPIYYGDPLITDYFPEESMIRINLEKPEEALAVIERAIAEKKWEKNIDAIADARQKILSEYQFYPTVCRWIESYLPEKAMSKPKFIPYDAKLFRGYWRRIKQKINLAIKAR